MEKKYEEKRRGRSGRRMTDLTGKRFGRLTAEYPTARRDHKGSVYWHCRCDCGGETEATEDVLIFGNSLSCGCLKREKQKRIAGKLHRVDGTCVEWLEKRRSRRDNTSGFCGISRMKNGKYRVTIEFKRERFYLGTYSSMEEAVEVRKKAEREIHEAFVEKYHEWEKRREKDPEWGENNPLIFRVEKEPGNSYRIVSSL